MSSVDERIVEMRFDNQQFESGVQKSLRTLDQLKSGLNLEKSAKSLETFQASANAFDLSGIASGVDAVSNRVSALGIVGDQVIRYLTNQFLQLGEAAARTIKSLTSDQIGVGFGKYEQKIQSVQTIMNATGKSVDEVNARIDKLNWFTDETSYSLTDMIDNISKFTSSGIDLDTAVTSMIGIADAAGLAGASVGDASHAMEGFSKAIAQGYMSRQNWQWIRTAHMDTMQFKQSLIDASVAAGTLIESSDADGMKTYATATGNAAVSIADFETALHEGWLTTEVMNSALHDFGGATEEIYKEYERTGELTSDIIARMDGQLDELGLKAFRASQEAKTFSDAINSVKDAVSTGWMKSFEYIFGNKEEATRLWTEVANELWDVFAASGERRNEILKAWHNSGGYQDVLDGIRDTWASIKSISSAVKDAFSSLFASDSDAVKRLLSISKKVKEFGKTVRKSFVVEDKYLEIFEKLPGLYEQVRSETGVTDKAAQQYKAYQNLVKIREAFGGIKSIVDLVKFSFKSLGAVFSPVLRLFKIGSTGGILDFAASIGRFVTNTVDAIINSETLANVIDGLTNIIDGAVTIFKSFGENVKKVFKNVIESKAFREISSKVKELGSSFKESFGKTIQNGISKVTQFFKDFAEKFDADAIYDKVKKVWAVFQDFWSLLEDLYQRVVNFISPVFQTLGNIFKDLGIDLDSVLDGISQFFQELRESDSPLSVVIGKIQDFGTYLSGIWKRIKDSFSKLTLSSIWDYIVQGFETVRERVTQSLEKIGETLSKLNWGKILTVSLGIGAVLALLKFTKAVSEVGKIFRAIRWVGESISGYFDKVAIKKIATSVLLFSASIGILTASLVSISKIPRDELIQSGIALALLVGGLITMLGGLAIAFGILGKKELIDLEGIKSAAIGMVAMSASVVLLILSLEKLTKLSKDPQSLVLGLLGIMVLLSTLVTTAAFLGKVAPAAKGIGLGLLSMSLSLFVLMGFIKAIGKDKNKDLAKTAKENIWTIITIFGMLTALTALTRLGGKNGFSGGLGVLALSAALLVVYSAIKKLGSLRSSVLVKGLTSVVIILAAMSELGRVIGRANKYTIKGGLSIAIMSASLLLIYSAVKKFGKMNFKEMAKGLAGVGTILLAFGLLMHSMKIGAFESGIKTAPILAMTLAIGVLVASLAYLTLFDWKDLLISAVALGGVIMALGGALRLAGGGNGIRGANITMFVAGIVALVAVAYELIKLKDIPWQQLLSSAGAISAVLLAMGGSIRMLQESGWNHYNGKSFLGFLSGLAAIFVIGAVLKYMNEQNFSWQNMAASAGGISAVLLSLAGAIKITQGVKAGASLGALIDIIVWIALLSAALAGLAYLAEAVNLSDAHVAQVERIGSMIGGFVGGIFGGLASGFGLGMSIALPTIATNLSTFMTNLEPFLTSVSSLPDDFGTKMDALSSGLLKIGKAELKDAWANLINNIAGITPDKSFPSKLNLLGTALKDFDTALTDVDPANLEQNIDNLSKLIDLFGELPKKYPEFAENPLGAIIGGIVNAFEGQTDFTSFTSGMVALASGLQIFQRFTKGVSADAISEPIDCIAKLTEALGKIPKTGPIKDFLLGKAEWSNLSKGLAEMGKALVGFSKEVSGKEFDADAIHNAIKPASELNDLLQSIPEVWGVIPLITGISTWSTLSTGLVQFGIALSAFSRVLKIGKPDKGVIHDAIEPAKELAALLDVIPPAEGWEQTILGSNEWSTLTKGLVDLGKTLVKFSDVVSGVEDGASAFDSEKTKPAIEALGSLVTALSDLNKYGVFVNEIMDYADAFERFGTKINTMFTNMSGVDTERLHSIVTDLITLRDIMKPGESGKQSFGQSVLESIKGFGSGLVSAFKEGFGSEEEESGETMAEAFWSQLTSGFDTLAKTEDLSSVGVGLINAIGDAFLPGNASGNEALTNAASNFMRSFKGWFETQSGKADMNIAANAIVSGLTTGMETGYSDVYTAGQQLGSKAVGGASDAGDRMLSVGAYAGDGFVIGIQSKLGEAYAAGFAIGNEGVKGAAAGAQTASPSKATMKIGAFVGEGLSLGMLSMTSKIERSAEQMAGSSILSVASVFDTIDAALAGDIDFNPVITPVLDLSAVSYGASQINGLLNNDASLRLAGEVQAEQTSKDLSEMLILGRAILKEIQNGSELYFDDGVLAGRINRRLGSL